MKKIAKLLFTACMLTVLAPSFCANASVLTVSSNISETMQPRASVIVYKFRNYKGRMQYRRWNETKGCWVDPAWIYMK